MLVAMTTNECRFWTYVATTSKAYIVTRYRQAFGDENLSAAAAELNMADWSAAAVHRVTGITWLAGIRAMAAMRIIGVMVSVRRR